MVRTETIKSIDKLMEIVSEQNYNGAIKRYRSSSLYRGLPNADYTLMTSLQRNCGNKQEEIENSILRNFY